MPRTSGPRRQGGGRDEPTPSCSRPPPAPTFSGNTRDTEHRRQQQTKKRKQQGTHEKQKAGRPLHGGLLSHPRPSPRGERSRGHRSEQTRPGAHRDRAQRRAGLRASSMADRPAPGSQRLPYVWGEAPGLLRARPAVRAQTRSFRDLLDSRVAASGPLPAPVSPWPSSAPSPLPPSACSPAPSPSPGFQSSL